MSCCIAACKWPGSISWDTAESDRTVVCVLSCHSSYTSLYGCEHTGGLVIRFTLVMQTQREAAFGKMAVALGRKTVDVWH